MSQTGQNLRAKKAFVPLAKSHPLLAAQWHPTNNEHLTPADVWANYSRKVWWRCEKGHEWHQRIRPRDAFAGKGSRRKKSQ